MGSSLLSVQSLASLIREVPYSGVYCRKISGAHSVNPAMIRKLDILFTRDVHYIEEGVAEKPENRSSTRHVYCEPLTCSILQLCDASLQFLDSVDVSVPLLCN